MLKVSEILRVKGDTLYTASPDMPVSQAVQTMSEQDIGSLVIMEFGTLTGMLTFREIIRHMHAHGGAGETTIRSIMDDAPVSVSPYTSADEVVRLMLKKYARYISVMVGPTPVTVPRSRSPLRIGRVSKVIPALPPKRIRPTALSWLSWSRFCSIQTVGS